ncbi:MAG: methionyl-tRNA formyltransferase [Bacteroidales bacterium]|jgi:methionyl-tRNA formyltransferase
MKNLRIVFMGTPEFAVATLGSLIMNGINVVGVVTSPDKPSGRGRKMTKSAVKVFAEFSNLPCILQPLNLKDTVFISSLKNLNADLFIVVAFRMLPEEVWKMPPLGTINLHASLLPDYRGAAPINRAIINGETTTGVTTFFIDEKIDTGNILLREEVQIFPFENAGDLHDRLMKLGARLVIRTVADISENNIRALPQTKLINNAGPPKLAPKIHPNDCIIDWSSDPVKIHNLVRGLAPYPCARSWFKSDSTTISFKIFESQPEIEKHAFKPGTIFSDGKQYMRISCKDGFLNIASLQLGGKTRMNTVEFLRGFRIKDFTVAVIQPA